MPFGLKLGLRNIRRNPRRDSVLFPNFLRAAALPEASVRARYWRHLDLNVRVQSFEPFPVRLRPAQNTWQSHSALKASAGSTLAARRAGT
jgi:hypothetical protein